MSEAAQETANVVIRTPSPNKGQGQYRAISQRTGWEYEHDETDEQIDALELLILKTRAASGAATDNDGKDDVTGDVLEGATFSWNVDEAGNVAIGTTWGNPSAWQTSSWLIAPDGTVTAA